MVRDWNYSQEGLGVIGFRGFDFAFEFESALNTPAQLFFFNLPRKPNAAVQLTQGGS